MNEKCKTYLDYFSETDSGNKSKSSKHEKALDIALDIRKFETDLYWKRATYFWTLTAATIAVYTLVFTKSGSINDNSMILLLLSCLGFVFSMAWFFVNKGSKFWIENWEAHVVMLEDEYMGPLYKLNMTDEANKDKWCFASSGKYSVSVINQILSAFVAVIFFLLIVKSLWPICPTLHFDLWKLIIVVISSVATALIVTNGSLRFPGEKPKGNSFTASLRSAHCSFDDSAKPSE